MVMAEEWLGSLARVVARAGNRQPKLVLVVACLISLVCVVYSCLNLRFLTSRNDMISPSKKVQRRWKDHLARVGGTEDDMVVVFAGADEAGIQIGRAHV